MPRLTEAHWALLRKIRRDKTRPGTQSDDWDRFLDLADEDLVEDLGLGTAKVTPKGQYALKTGRADAVNSYRAALNKEEGA